MIRSDINTTMSIYINEQYEKPLLLNWLVSKARHFDRVVQKTRKCCHYKLPMSLMLHTEGREHACRSDAAAAAAMYVVAPEDEKMKLKSRRVSKP